MINWVTTRRHAYTIKRHLACFGSGLKRRVRPLTYAGLRWARPNPGDSYILADIERLSARDRQRFSAVCDDFKAAGCQVLNRPHDVRLRHSLLRGLSDVGLNKFDVYRVADGERCQQFPVYLRCENDHRGSRSRLLQTAAELEAAIRQHSSTHLFFRDEHNKRRLIRVGSRRRRQLLVTEFCDTADASGVYRKYSAFNVGGKIVARHLFFGTNWMLKAAELMSPEFLAEELDYVESNPHQEQLQRVFEFARIQYGRIDYAMLDRRVQVWEINTNPMITSPVDEVTVERMPVQRAFSAGFEEALLSLAKPRTLRQAA